MQFPSRTSLLVGASAIALLIGVAGSASAQNISANAAGTTTGNTALDVQSVRSNAIDGTQGNAGSFNASSGIAHVQQNNGSNNGLGAASAVSGGLRGNVAVTVGATANAASANNVTQHTGNGELVDRSNRIDNSFNRFAGEATVQQNNGDHNQMSAATAMYGSVASLLAVNQFATATGQTVGQRGTGAGGALEDGNSRRLNSIDPSFTRGSGVATVQQNNGNGNAISAATSVLGATTTGALSQTAFANGVVLNLLANDASLNRRNDILSSFNFYRGIATVQQNNGDSNAMSAATAVAAVTGSAASVFQRVVAVGTVRGVNATDRSGPSLNRIANSLIGGSGVSTVQQNNGTGTVMSAATAVVTADGQGGIRQDVTKGGTTVGNTVVDTSINLDQNLILNSYNGYQGIVTAMQNNGIANVMSSATAVAHSKGPAVQNVTGTDVVQGNTVNDTGTGPNLNRIISSFNPSGGSPFSGVATVQQNNGHANVVSAATAVAANNGMARQQVIKRQTVTGNVVIDTGGLDQNLVLNSFSGAMGVITVQQNNGHANAIDSAKAVAVVDAVQVVNATGVVAANTIRDLGGVNQNLILNSFVNAQGVINVQQNNGHGNAIASAEAVVAAASSVGPTQTVTATGIVGGANGNAARDQVSTRLNLIDGNAFNGSMGVSTVQQNNGNANALQAASAVEANTGGSAVSQTVRANGNVANNSIQDVLSATRRNEILNSYNNASGVMTVQQNNGDGNVLAASSAVAQATGAGFTTDARQSVAAIGRGISALSTDIDAPANGLGERMNVIDPSFAGASGVATVQQNNGSNNVVAAATGVFVDRTTGFDGGDEDVLFQNAATVGSVTGATRSFEQSQNVRPPPYDRRNQIVRRSFDSYSGTATVQQNNGDNNVVAAATAVAARVNALDDFDNVGTAAPAVAATSGLVNQSTSLHAQDIFANRQNQIGNSFGEVSGIFTVQQNNGNSNVMGSATGVVANIGTASFHGSVANQARGSANVTNNRADAFASQRGNAIDDSFNGASMVGTVQQNNGDNNVMGAATQVTASDSGAGSGFGPAMSLAALNSTVTGNTAVVAAVGGVLPSYSNSISGSFNGATGVVTVQQNNGANNAITSAMTVVSNF